MNDQLTSVGEVAATILSETTSRHGPSRANPTSAVWGRLAVLLEITRASAGDCSETAVKNLEVSGDERGWHRRRDLFSR